MLNRQNLSNRIEVLKSKGVKSGREYVQLKPKRNIEIGQLVSAESEIAIAELISERFSDEIGITLHPCYPPPIDVDIEIRDQGAIFSVQVKTFEMITSRYGKRMSEAVKDWDTTLPQGENAYVARRYVGADLISEAIRPVKGVNRLARVGAFHFHPSVDDLWQMWLKIQGTLEEAQKQLCYASGIRVVVYDVRRSYIDGETLYLAVNDLKRAGASETYVEGVVILMYDFEGEPKARPVLAPIWIASGYERGAMAPFRPPHPIRLFHAHPFEMPIHYYHNAGWQNLFTVEKGTIKIDDVPFGPLI